MLDRPIARVPRLEVGWNRVEVRRVGRVRHRGALAMGLREHLLEQELGALRAFELQHPIESIAPFLGLQRVRVCDRGHSSSRGIHCSDITSISLANASCISAF